MRRRKKHVPGARTTPDALLWPVVGGDKARSDDGDGSDEGDKSVMGVWGKTSGVGLK